MSVHRRTDRRMDRNASKKAYLPVSLHSPGGYNKSFPKSFGKSASLPLTA